MIIAELLAAVVCHGAPFGLVADNLALGNWTT
jgi:hypothetical protein